MRVIILAAGKGERMMPLTENIPKSILPIGEETVIGRIIRQLRECSFDDINMTFSPY